MFNLSIFDCLTEEERNLYNEFKINNKIDVREEIKKKILMSVKSFSGIREINRKTLFDKNGEPIISKLIAGFENECVACRNGVRNEPAENKRREVERRDTAEYA